MDNEPPYITSLAGRVEHDPDQVTLEEIVIGCVWAVVRARDWRLAGNALTRGGEHTSPRVEAIAERGILNPASLTREEVRSVFASLLTQAPDRFSALAKMLANAPGAHAYYNAMNTIAGQGGRRA